MADALLKTYTLGCKVNQYETQYVREGLLGVGYRDAQPGETADLCVINTCTVTAEGDAKSRQVIRRMARENPQARMVVMGCYATRAPDELAALPNVAEVVTDKRELPDLLGRFGVIDIPTGISRFGNRHRAYVKVQDGCLLRCSYCIIPLVRPKMHSRPMADILEEVRRLTDNGYREIVLTGIHLGHYGVDGNWNRPKDQWLRLSQLVREIVRLPGDFRVRLSSIEATELTRELLQVMADHADRVCPHLHVCLQSGADSVLRRMNRRWGAQRFVDRCRLAVEMLDHPALTTDVIVGFPGETDAEFQQTCDAVSACGFSKIHIFPFSPRRGTPAASLPDQIPPSTQSERTRALADLEMELRSAYFQSLAGRSLRVLVESIEGSPSSESQDLIARAAEEVEGSDHRPAEHVVGTSCRYAPVRLPGSVADVGKFVDVVAGPPLRRARGILELTGQRVGT